ncbi:MAG: PadR family transcriptional regulator [Phycisphaerales bacterium]|nr:PadR family transcriptional regulator [Phycisphaerales bacterium]
MLTLKQDHSELVVLSVLAIGPSYGYAISKDIAARSEGHFKLSPSGMYPLLTKLEKNGLVTTGWDEVKAAGADPDSTGRRRKWYTLSPKGQRQLAQSIERHRQVQSILDGFVSPSMQSTPQSELANG